MWVVASFLGSSGDYFLACASCELPFALQKLLWPWVEEWEACFEA
jgi:hypothetical protein